jgi:hypothetical protein
VILLPGELGEEPELTGGEHQHASTRANEMLVRQDLERPDHESLFTTLQCILHDTMLTLPRCLRVNGS